MNAATSRLGSYKEIALNERVCKVQEEKPSIARIRGGKVFEVFRLTKEERREDKKKQLQEPRDDTASGGSFLLSASTFSVSWFSIALLAWCRHSVVFPSEGARRLLFFRYSACRFLFFRRSYVDTRIHVRRWDFRV
ncbi:hypothetical protein NDU88_004799 [Pleurodeles waltl]|uniref:Uncharacterized protein n=1 Tax=Pleurodeles waltl TaxID=8319 RepID=A0AAV7TTL0_PLEWA|nr:hypothetical protein NDU88_004799 [Pleurodeles waltl]